MAKLDKVINVQVNTPNHKNTGVFQDKRGANRILLRNGSTLKNRSGGAMLWTAFRMPGVDRILDRNGNVLADRNNNRFTFRISVEATDNLVEANYVDSNFSE